MTVQAPGSQPGPAIPTIDTDASGERTDTHGSWVARSGLALSETWWLIRQLWKRRRLWTVLAIVFALLVVGAAIVRAHNANDTPRYIVSDIVLSLSVALLAAALIDLSTQAQRIYEVHRQQRQFKDLFGFRDDGTRVALVLPAYTGARTDIWKKHVEMWKERAPYIPTDPSETTPLNVAVQEDVKAASDIIAAFGSLQLDYPEIIWDSSGLEHVKDKNSRFRSFIVVGLYSNKVACWLNEQTGIGRYFAMSIDKNTDSEGKHTDNIWDLKLAKAEGGNIDFDEKKWIARTRKNVAFEAGGDVDYALIAKVYMKDGRSVFLLGGIGAPATDRIGRYFRDNWASVWHWRDDLVTGNPEVQYREFAGLLDVPLDESRDIGNERTVRVNRNSRPLS